MVSGCVKYHTSLFNLDSPKINVGKYNIYPSVYSSRNSYSKDALKGINDFAVGLYISLPDSLRIGQNNLPMDSLFIIDSLVIKFVEDSTLHAFYTPTNKNVREYFKSIWYDLFTIPPQIQNIEIFVYLREKVSNSFQYIAHILNYKLVRYESHKWGPWVGD